LYAAGVRVATGCSLNSARKGQWISDMKAQGYDAFVVELDVSKWDSAKAALQRV
jgi:hypothetical protein